MGLITNPEHYNVCFGIASLLVIIVVLIIHLAEETHSNKQKRIFGMLLYDALILNVAGLLHNIWLYSDYFRLIVPAVGNDWLVLVEKICSYLLAYISMIYVMTIYRIELDSSTRKILLFVPTLFSVLFFLSGLISDFFFTFSPEGELEYNYPQGALVNFSLYVYFIYAAYLYVKYARSLSSEKFISLVVYYVLMLSGVPIRIITKSSSIFEFSVSLALLLCVYTVQNPGEFRDGVSGAGTKNALNFAISSNLLQKKIFTVFGVALERLEVLVGGESLEAISELLSQITFYLKQISPEGEVYYTDDGHYMMLFPDVDPDDAVIEKATEQINKRFKDTWTMKGRDVKIFQSSYVLGFPDEVDSLDKFNEVREVIKKSLIHHNRDILRVSDLNLKHIEHDKKIDLIVKHALDDDLLEVYYQPIYDPKTGLFSSCEALLRLRNPQMGFISPAVFMPVAERNGMVVSIDSFVLDEVCNMLANTDAAQNGLDYAEVNLSVVDCIQANLYENVIKTMEKHGVKPEQLNFEITETFEEGITSVMDENIGKLISYGIPFSMDDFGTGYSNLARIATLPVEIFKLDKSIIQSAFESENSYMVMLNLVKIIKSLGKEIVAEGVETEEQAEQIIRIGCDHIQGFYYARPMPKDQFLEFLRENNKH
ncbi:EAL domain-containing protein [Butyrivibrio sp. XPD2006]|uniref:EAL domain-containing protein n=1 Tax=Butyrivibrio sp. XPD2006 TaxID=1280668 RepID=UPI0003B32F7B|nr:EAL domain-containing protein [Butyrivibrio sp. XPD2006]